MKYGRLEPPGRVAVVEVPSPEAGAGEIVVEMAACGICGTDLEKVKGGYTATATLGHEPVGRVASMGPGVKGFARGDRVFVHHHVPCRTCAICARGDYTFCPDYQKTNLDPGGFAERFRVSAHHLRAGAVLPLDPTVSWEEGSLLEPAGCVLTALRRVGFSAGSSVFVYGLGPVGLLYARVARAMGASWVGGAEIAPLRRSAAERGGIDVAIDPREPGHVPEAVRAATEGRGVDLAVVATGAKPAVAGALEIARRGGTVNLFGLPGAGSQLDTDLQRFYLRGLKLIPSYATGEEEIAEIHRLIVTRRLPVRDLVSDRFPLDALETAFDRAGHPEATLKVVVTGPAFA
jgi:L-iditol 2-dehydrogenase